jgi:hypothetical protein
MKPHSKTSRKQLSLSLGEMCEPYNHLISQIVNSSAVNQTNISGVDQKNAN